jgi:hypothetical protein
MTGRECREICWSGNVNSLRKMWRGSIQETSFHGFSVVDLITFKNVSCSHYQFLCPVDSQDVELAEVLRNLENSSDVDEDSVLGSQISQELQDETVHVNDDDEDMQDFSQPLDAAVDWNKYDYQKGNLNRYVLRALKVIVHEVKSHTCLVSDVLIHSNSQ